MSLSHPYTIARVNADEQTDYPAYELYTDVLRNGIYEGETGRQLRLVVGHDRKVQQVVVL